MKKHSFFLLFTAAIIIASCEQQGTTTTGTNTSDSAAAPAFDLAKARTWIENDNAKFVEEAKKGDSNAMAAHYASDGWAMFNNSEPFKGTAAIASAWGSAIRMGMKDIKVTTVDVVGGPEALAETGMYEMYGEGNKLIDKGKYVVVWKPENDGWKIYRDIGNSNMPPKK
jgi:ketosteroid isomerase-like protein